ncbi:MAG TPA: hypothetical protein DCW68_04630 [Rhodospirillaceae bacterium]|nr:MAG: hypothetical protein A2018_03020 [Alphaproteobacteria bacterium GWF2_58_20]HAU29382.1 hypothetical protein [Rhodospirillaceae bacterium]
MMTGWLHLLGVFGLSFALSCGLGRMILPLLRKWHVIDHPNARSSHVLPTPRGGGLAITKTMVLGGIMLLFMFHLGWTAWLPIAGSVGVGIVSWMDDRKGLPVRVRLLVQMVAVVLPLWFMPHDRMVFANLLPLVPDRILAGLCWLWFINLFNFMDGIDGIAAGEGTLVALGLAVVGILSGASEPFVLASLVVAGAALGFLVWNWHPAKMFMGDVGSIPLGYILGWLLLVLASHGQLASAIILPLYFVMDASVTLIRRGLKREKIWQAHREHFYQKAVIGGRSHAWVSSLVMFTTLVLIGISVMAIWLGGIALLVAFVPVVALMWIFSHPRPMAQKVAKSEKAGDKA